MTTRRVLGGGAALAGAVALMIFLAGLLSGHLALAPFGFLGIVLLGAGLMTLPGAAATAHRPDRNHRFRHAPGIYGGPTGDVGADYGHHSHDPDHDRPGGGDGGWSGGGDGGGWSGGGGSGSGWSGGGDSGGGGGGGSW